MVSTILNTSALDFRKVKRSVFATKLNLVALMDIFTILVFFLLLNSGDNERLENAKFVSLPDSTASTAAHDDNIIVIGEDEIWLNDQLVVSVEEVLKSKDANIEALATALNEYTEKRGELTPYEKANGLAVTIMGDQEVSYSLLQSVMSTCSTENFRDISLAVNRIAMKSSPSVSSASSQSSEQTSRLVASASGNKGG